MEEHLSKNYWGKTSNAIARTYMISDKTRIEINEKSKKNPNIGIYRNLINANSIHMLHHEFII